MSLHVPRIGLVCDFVEENWPSMDLVADMLAQRLAAQYMSRLRVVKLAPAMKGCFQAVPVLGSTRLAYNADRGCNRLLLYPRWLRSHAGGCDLYHVVDHTYSNLLHALPRGRAVVTCHDLDAFKCIVDRTHCRRALPFRAMAEHTLKGLRRAQWVMCVSRTTRSRLVACGVIPAERICVIPNGVHPSCSSGPDEPADATAERLLGPRLHSQFEMLHVGSTVPRKRIDVLLEVTARLRRIRPATRLIRVGGQFTSLQTAQLERLNLRDAVTVVPRVDRAVLAAIYRRASVLLQTSEDEGFGLPVVEALACGTPVVASDIPALREVGEPAVAFCPVGELGAWTATVSKLWDERTSNVESWNRRRAMGLEHARQFSWDEHTRKVVEIYDHVLTTGDRNSNANA